MEDVCPGLITNGWDEKFNSGKTQEKIVSNSWMLGMFVHKRSLFYSRQGNQHPMHLTLSQQRIVPCVLIVLSSVLCGLPERWAIANEERIPVQSHLKAGVAKVDITPADVEQLEVVGHRRKVTGCVTRYGPGC